MFRKRFVCLLLAAVLTLGCCGTAQALEVSSGDVYCFTPGDFGGEEPLMGICITDLPDPGTGAVLLGTRVLQCGDILTADQVAQMTFAPVDTEVDLSAEVSYLPIYENRVDPGATLTLAIRGREDKAPVAEDLTLETYKNLPNEGTLKATDPEGQPMTYTLIRQPRRGSVELGENGTFVYTPKKNKVGVDSFTYTATDPAGKVSREATVTVQILKPTDSKLYTDTLGLDCRFEAEWLRATGLFEGEKLGAEHCFQPEKAVTRGQFLAMVMELLEIPVEESAAANENVPRWLQPYLTAALRSGLVDHVYLETFDAHEPITGGEAAVILQNALDLPLAAQTADTDIQPTFRELALRALADKGLALEAEQTLDRGGVARLLYEVSRLAPQAPGLAEYH